MFITNSISPSEYMGLRKAVGWGEFPLEEAKAGLDHSYIWCIREDEGRRPIGLARVFIFFAILKLLFYLKI